jgi:hypothetical protein
MTAWSIPALGMLQTDKTNKQLAICLGSELEKPPGRDANADKTGQEG